MGLTRVNVTQPILSVGSIHRSAASLSGQHDGRRPQDRIDIHDRLVFPSAEMVRKNLQGIRQMKGCAVKMNLRASKSNLKPDSARQDAQIQLSGCEASLKQPRREVVCQTRVLVCSRYPIAV